MTPNQAKFRRENIALFRYRVIGELLHLTPGTPEYREEFQRVVAKEWLVPGSTGRRRYSAQTIRNWIKKYTDGKITGLERKPRRDQGKPRNLSLATIEILLAIKRQHPKFSVRKVIREAKRHPDLPPTESLPRTTVHRLWREEGLMTVGEPTLLVDRRRFNYECANELWLSDVRHGPKIRDRHRRRRKTYLTAILDDATRFVVFAEFHWNEKAETLLQVLKQATQRKGIPDRFYVDNGACFKNHHVTMVTANLGIAQVFARPRQPQGKGKIERFFRTVREQFLDSFEDREPENLAELNRRWQLWLQQEYHRASHRGLEGRTPLEAWCDRGTHLRAADTGAVLDDLFLIEKERTVNNDSTVSLYTHVYEVSSALIGKRVTLRYDPTALGIKPVKVRFEDRDFAEGHPIDTVHNARSRRVRKSDKMSHRQSAKTS